MKYRTEKITYIHMSLDSSEMIMFTKGGSHKIVFSPDILEGCDQIHFTIQLEGAHQARFDWISSEAQKQKNSRDENENQSS